MALEPSTKKNIQLRGGVILGEGMPKICVPVVGNTVSVFYHHLLSALSSSPDLVEFRVDDLTQLNTMPFSNIYAFLNEMLSLAQKTCPVLLTYRSRRDGGYGDPNNYTVFLQELILSKLPIDLLDIEISTGENDFSVLRKQAAEHHIPIIASWHKFSQTPSHEDLLGLFTRMEDWGGNIAKVAVMPNQDEDVDRLISAAKEANRKLSIPLIAISMDSIGVRTRLNCTEFGSCMTFASAGKNSAPGQIDIYTVKQILTENYNHQKG